MVRTVKSRNRKLITELSVIEPLSESKEDILSYIIFTDLVPNYVLKILTGVDNSLLEDITQEIWLMILEIDQLTWSSLYKQGNKSILRYISGLIYRLIKSSTSFIYKKYKLPSFMEIKFEPTVWEIYSLTNNAPQMKTNISLDE